MLFQGQSQDNRPKTLKRVNAIIARDNFQKGTNQVDFRINGSSAPAKKTGLRVNCFNQCGLVPPEARCRVRLSL